jgi:hypothetical protein
MRAYQFLLTFFLFSTPFVFAQFELPEEIYVCPGQTSVPISMQFTPAEEAFLNEVSSATFTQLSLTDDQFSPVIGLGFNFSFYGQTYSTCLISSNNYISFNTNFANGICTFNELTTLGINSSNTLKNSILAPFQDLKPSAGGTLEYATVGTAPNRKFVIRWLEVQMWQCPQIFCSAIVLKEGSNTIETHLINKPICYSVWNGAAIHGVIDQTGANKEVVYDYDENVNRDHGQTWTTKLEGTVFNPIFGNDYTVSSTNFLPIVSSNSITWTDNLGNNYPGSFSTNVQIGPNTDYVFAHSDLCSEDLTDTVFIKRPNIQTAINGVTGNTIDICPNTNTTLSIASNTDPTITDISWSNGDTTLSTEINTNGTYSVSANINGCVIDTHFVVDLKETPIVNLDDTIYFCAGSNKWVNAAYTHPSTTYQWSNGSNASSINITAEGTYSVDLTLNGCTHTESFYAKKQQLPIVDLGADTNICSGTNLNLSSGLANSYSWSTGATSQSILVSNPGTYWVESSSNGCSKSDTIVVGIMAAPTISLADTTFICAGDTANLNAFYPGATYLWSNTQTTSNIDVYSAGIYTVKLTLNDCEFYDSTLVIINNLPITNLGNDIEECDGNIVNLNVQENGANYLWSNSATTQSINVTTSGIYHVEVEKNGCTSYDTIEVNFDPIPTISLPDTVDLCSGDSTTLDAFFTGATYTWSNGSSNSQITVGSSGMYFVDVELNDCNFKDTTHVFVNNYPITNLGNDIEECDGNIVNLNVQENGANYLWSNSATTQSINVTTSGIYHVEVEKSGCTSYDTIEVTFDPIPTISLPDTVNLCAGDSTTLDAFFTGATYTWSNSSTNSQITVETSGMYFVDVELNDCNFKDTTHVFVNNYPVTNLGNDIEECDGIPVALTVQENGANYLWSNSATTQSINVTTSGIYHVEVEKNGCTSYDTIQVTFNPIPTISLPDTVNLCAGDSTTLNAFFTGATYDWNNGSTNAQITVGTSGVYFVDVELNDCNFKDTTYVFVNNYPVTNLGNDIEECDGTPVVLTVQENGANYLWSNSATTQSINVTTSSIYHVEVEKNGCTSYDTIQVTFNPIPTISLPDTVNLCAGDSTTLNAFFTGATYDWNNGSTSAQITVGSSGMYFVDVELNNCNFKDTTYVFVHNYPITNLGTDITECDGVNVNLNVQENGANYLWSNSATTQSINVTTSGIYHVEVEKNGCISYDTIEVTFNPIPVITLPDTVHLCDGDSTTLDASYTGATYDWSNGSTNAQITVNTSGMYFVDIELNDCNYSDTTFVFIHNFPNVSLQSGYDFCEGDSVLIDAFYNSTATYTWSTGATGAAEYFNQTGIYWVEINDFGCTQKINFAVKEREVPKALLQDEGICFNESAVLDVTQPFVTKYTWSTGETTSLIEVKQEGYYWVDMETPYCSFRDSMYLSVSDAPTFELPTDTFICNNEGPIYFNFDSIGDKFLWSTGDTTGQQYLSQPGIYWVTVENACGIKSDTIIIDQQDCTCKIYMPTVVTIQANGENSEFKPSADCPFDKYELSVYNRWGNEVFTSKDPTSSFHPYNEGHKSNQTFIYILRYSFDGGEETIKKGVFQAF